MFLLVCDSKSLCVNGPRRTSLLVALPRNPSVSTSCQYWIRPRKGNFAPTTPGGRGRRILQASLRRFVGYYSTVTPPEHLAAGVGMIGIFGSNSLHYRRSGDGAAMCCIVNGAICEWAGGIEPFVDVWRTTPPDLNVLER